VSAMAASLTSQGPGETAGTVADAAPSSSAYVRIEGVTKRFGDFAAVDQVCLEIHRGEIFCLLGGSGSGKTTLLRMLAGFETPSAGKIYIDGQDMSTCPPYERPVNMMFQSYALFPHMTVERNVAFGLEQEGLSRQEVRERVAEILAIVQMSPYLARKPHQLSGGQRQRVALARALVKRPKLLLLDEPLAALDRKLREQTQFELLQIQHRLGVTFIVVTHDQEEAMTLATRMGVMSAGRIVQIGTPAQIYESPSSKLVADFIGQVNLLEGEVLEAVPGALVLALPELGGETRVENERVCLPGTRVWLALRPEKIGMSREPPAGQAVLRGEVTEIAYMGDISIYLVRIDSGKLLRVTLPNIARDAERRIVRGESVHLYWHPGSPVVLTE
jgi:putrescine transport system ATP-binding protein